MGYLIVMGFYGVFLNMLFDKTFVNSYLLFGFAALVLLVIPFIGTKFIKWKYNLSDIEKHEKHFEEQGYKLLVNTYGEKEYEKLLQEEITGHNFDGIQSLKGLLAKNETESNPGLKFFICSMLGKFLYRDEQYNSSIEYLKEALSINSNNSIVNLRLAVVYEYLGNEAESLKAYNRALKDRSIKFKQVRDYIILQINRVRTKGPRKGPPHPGLRYFPF